MRRLLISSAAMMAVLAATPVMAQAPATPPAAQALSEDARLNAFFEQAFQARIAMNPQQMTALGSRPITTSWTMCPTPPPTGRWRCRRPNWRR